MGQDPHPNSVVLMDNHKSHKWNVFQLVAAHLGVRIIYFPSYSPDFNSPAEEFFRTLKQRVARHREYYIAAPRQAIIDTVLSMALFDIWPILDRIGYTFYCRP